MPITLSAFLVKLNQHADVESEIRDQSESRSLSTIQIHTKFNVNFEKDAE